MVYMNFFFILFTCYRHIYYNSRVIFSVSKNSILKLISLSDWILFLFLFWSNLKLWTLETRNLARNIISFSSLWQTERKETRAKRVLWFLAVWKNWTKVAFSSNPTPGSILSISWMDKYLFHRLRFVC